MANILSSLLIKSISYVQGVNTIERVRIKTRLSHIFMKNELRVFFIRKPDYASFGYVIIPLLSLVTSNLRHLDVVSAKTRSSMSHMLKAFLKILYS